MLVSKLFLLWITSNLGFLDNYVPEQHGCSDNVCPIIIDSMSIDVPRESDLVDDVD